MSACLLLALGLCPALATAQSCLSPPMPILPSDPSAMAEYADILRGDFEFYFRDIQAYFVCLDIERERAVADAQEVTDAYRHFLDAVGTTEGGGS